MFYGVDCITLVLHCHGCTQHGGHIADFYYKFTKSAYGVVMKFVRSGYYQRCDYIVAAGLQPITVVHYPMYAVCVNLTYA